MKDTTDVDRGADATGANATGAGTDYVEAGEPSGESTLCPVPLPPDYHAVAYKRGVTVERWQASSAMSCRDAARELLLILQEEGFELVKAGYLDVSGEIWGCTVKTSEGASLVISLVPKSLGALRDEQNKLTLTIVRITSPEIAPLAEGLS
ncbi:MAG: hypothetical protein LBC23_00180 [Coriobacteriales bacterium]|nr:hypothetical protein [Coriobacteriales bacterium]